MGNPRVSNDSKMADARPELNRFADGSRQCWVCFGTDAETPVQSRQWVTPCRCKGSTQWVHQECIRRWVEQKQRGQLTLPVHCPQCQTAYIIHFPRMGPLLLIMDNLDKLVMRVSPIGMATLIGMTLYWNSFSYGIFTVYTILGKQETAELFDRLDPIATVVGLPLIPVALIFVNAIPLVEKAIKFYFNILGPRMKNVPFLSYFAPSYPLNPPAAVDTNSNSLPVLARTICGALAFPYMATLVGYLVFKSVKPNWKRAFFVSFVLCANTSHGGDGHNGRGTVRVVAKLRNLICPIHSFVTNKPKAILYRIEAKLLFMSNAQSYFSRI